MAQTDFSLRVARPGGVAPDQRTCLMARLLLLFDPAEEYSITSPRSCRRILHRVSRSLYPNQVFACLYLADLADFEVLVFTQVTQHLLAEHLLSLQFSRSSRRFLIKEEFKEVPSQGFSSSICV